MALVLPELCIFSGVGDEWPAYEDLIYGHFCADFLDANPKQTFRGRVVGVQREPADQGRAKAFWHLISKGMNEANREIDLRRCERIRWPAVLLGAPEANRRVWAENDRGKFTHLGVALPDFRYVLFLRVWPTSYQLLTAYVVEEEHVRAKYGRAWEAEKR